MVNISGLQTIDELLTRKLYLTKKELRASLHYLGLPVSGNRDVLVSRLLYEYTQETIEDTLTALMDKGTLRRICFESNLPHSGTKNTLMKRILSRFPPAYPDKVTGRIFNVVNELDNGAVETPPNQVKNITLDELIGSLDIQEQIVMLLGLLDVDVSAEPAENVVRLLYGSSSMDLESKLDWIFNKEAIKDICRKYNIRGFSTKKKYELIRLIMDSFPLEIVPEIKDENIDEDYDEDELEKIIGDQSTLFTYIPPSIDVAADDITNEELFREISMRYTLQEFRELLDYINE
ncbi:MAG: SAP domain-containing protein, partial [Promethearchaeota archaeon]